MDMQLDAAKKRPRPPGASAAAFGLLPPRPAGAQGSPAPVQPRRPRRWLVRGKARQTAHSLYAKSDDGRGSRARHASQARRRPGEVSAAPLLLLCFRASRRAPARYTGDIYKGRLENQGETKQTKKSRRESSRSGRDGEGRPRAVPRHALGQRRRRLARRERPSVSRRRRPGRHRRRERRAERPPGAPRPSLRRLGVARRALVEGQAQQRRVLGAAPHELEKWLLAELRDRGPALGYELCGNQPAS